MLKAPTGLWQPRPQRHSARGTERSRNEPSHSRSASQQAAESAQRGTSGKTGRPRAPGGSDADPPPRTAAGCAERECES